MVTVSFGTARDLAWGCAGFGEEACGVRGAEAVALSGGSGRDTVVIVVVAMVEALFASTSTIGGRARNFSWEVVDNADGRLYQRTGRQVCEGWPTRGRIQG
jgi:hypothetical protein